MAKPQLRLFLLGIILPLGVLMMAQPTSAASTMSVSSNGSVNISVNPGSTGTGSDELTLTTNCSSGYVVYTSATSSSASTSLSNGSGSEISASSNTLASPGSLSDNTWGIANAENYANGKFAGLPTYANMAATSLTSGSSAASATKIPVYYGVKVNSSVAPGTYTGNVLYTAMVNSACYTYTISYDANGGSGTMNGQELPMNTETALSSNYFTRDGYTFLGWSEDKDAKVATFTDAQSVTGETFGLTENGTNVTLYAIWEEDTIVEMQNWLGCGKMAANEVATLLDVRNNVKYKVKKIVNESKNYSQCWMVENLRLTPGATDPGTSKVTSGTADVTTNTSQGVGSVTFSDSGFDKNTAGYTGLRATYNGNATYGAYYTWSAAQVVCPAGWHLPSGGSGSEFAQLDIALGGDGENRRSANTYGIFTGTDLESEQNLAFPLAGDYRSKTLEYIGQYGHYWSSTKYNDDNGYVLDFQFAASVVNLQNYYLNYFGFPVRCTANITTEVDGYMQDFDESAALPNVGDKATLVDKRDYSNYTVERLADGKVWMTQNLRLTDHTLTPDDSNVASSFKLEASNVSYFTPTAYAKRASTYYNNDTAYGAYYNFYAATAGYSYYNDGIASGTSSYDICPKNWRLPVGGTDKAVNSFSVIDIAVNGGSAGSDRTSATALKNLAQTSMGLAKTNGWPDFALAGSVLYALGNTGMFGFYWSSTVDSTSYGYTLYFDTANDYVYPQTYDYKYRGSSVRCLAKDAPYVITYDTNGGTGEATTTGTFAGATSAEAGTTITLATSGTLAKEGYTFQGWGTSASDTIIAYAGGEKQISVDTLAAQAATGKKITLYAIWKKNPANYTTESACTAVGGKFLADGKCWKQNSSRVTWANRNTACAGNWTVPSPGDYDTLVMTYDNSSNYSGTYRNGKRSAYSNLYTVLGISENTSFWSSQEATSDTSYAFNLYVSNSGSIYSYTDDAKLNGAYVLCLAS